MPLRLFGGGSEKVRACPACEHEIAGEAMFCPSCYMVFRPEGAVELRKHLHGSRVPADVYLLRKMHTEDPNTGPVILVSPEAQSAPRPAGVAAPAQTEPIPAPVPAPETPTPQVSDAPAPTSTPAPSPSLTAPPDTQTAQVGTAELPEAEASASPKVRAWKGVYALVKFDPPLPSPTQAVEEVPSFLAWMLERDPVIPNNLELLETIHTETFRDGPAGALGYQQHLLIQIADDLLLHPTQETLDTHLGLLGAAYRRAAGAYHAAARKGENERDAALWHMASTASRLRVEAWIYQSRYGTTPEIARFRKSRASGTSTD